MACIRKLDPAVASQMVVVTLILNIYARPLTAIAVCGDRGATRVVVTVRQNPVVVDHVNGASRR